MSTQRPAGTKTRAPKPGRLKKVTLAPSPQPLYQKVKDHILNLIREGEWAPDTCIPSENRLVDQLKVSRMTVNRALRELTEAGHLIRLQGVGTFVAHPKPLKALLEINSIVDEIRERGGEHSCEVHLLAEEKAYTELALVMQIPVGAPVYHSIMVNKDRGFPVQLADDFINPLLAPEYLQQDFTITNPTDYLRENIPITDVEHIIEALKPDPMMQRLLAIEPDEPCLMLHRQTWCDERVATHSRFIFPGSRHRIGGRFKPLPASGNFSGDMAVFSGQTDKRNKKREKQ